MLWTLCYVYLYIYILAQNMVRISDTGRVSEGRVDVFVDGEWQGVCDSAWDLRDATVVCRQVGYEFAVLANRNNPYGTGLLPVWRRQLHCSGNESSLSECRTSFMALCAYSAGVVCSRGWCSNYSNVYN